MSSFCKSRRQPDRYIGRMISALATAAVYVGDQAASLRFWTDQVGFVVHRSEWMGPQGSWIEVGPKDAASCLVLYPKSLMSDWSERKPSIVFSCDDVQRTYAELSSRGVQFSQLPHKMAWSDFAIFEDLDGNSFGLRPKTTEDGS
jgi:lactoylglutathione lyase